MKTSLSPVHTVAEKCTFLRQSPFSAPNCRRNDIGDYSRQCGQALSYTDCTKLTVPEMGYCGSPDCLLIVQVADTLTSCAIAWSVSATFPIQQLNLSLSWCCNILLCSSTLLHVCTVYITRNCCTWYSYIWPNIQHIGWRSVVVSAMALIDVWTWTKSIK